MESWIAVRSAMKVRTFQIIVLQGIVGSLPWAAVVFFTMWFELIGTKTIQFFLILELISIPIFSTTFTALNPRRFQ